MIKPIFAEIIGEDAYFSRLGSFGRSEIVYRGRLTGMPEIESFGTVRVFDSPWGEPSARWRIGNGFVWQISVEEGNVANLHYTSRLRRIPADEFERLGIALAGDVTRLDRADSRVLVNRDASQAKLPERFTVAPCRPLDVAITFAAHRGRDDVYYDFIPIEKTACLLFIRRDSAVDVHRVDFHPKQPPPPRSIAWLSYEHSWSLVAHIRVDWDGPFRAMMTDTRVYFVTEGGVLYEAFYDPSGRIPFSHETWRVNTDWPVRLACAEPAQRIAYAVTAASIYALGEKVEVEAYAGDGSARIGGDSKEWLKRIRDAVSRTRVKGR